MKYTLAMPTPSHSPADSHDPEAALRARVQADAAGFHPLMVIPFFKRWKQGFLRDFIYTVIFNTMIASVFVMMAMLSSPSRTFKHLGDVVWGNFIASQIIGFVFFAVFALLTPFLCWLNRQSGPRVYFGYVFLSFGVYLLGSNVATLLPGFENWRRVIWQPSFLVGSFLFSMALSAVFYFAWRGRIEDLRGEMRAAEVDAAQNALKAQLATAELKLLQAQIEPHFLFNTLANVQSLIDVSPKDAKAMLTALNQLLRASLQQTRSKETTLAAEANLVTQYLTILKIRMGERLTFSVNVPEDLGMLTLPPLLLQPLVENAIKHGVESKVEGGEVSVTARKTANGVEIEVADTGLGFGAAVGTSGTGVGLQNVRDRIKATLGPNARLEVQDRAGGGTCVRVVVGSAA